MYIDGSGNITNAYAVQAALWDFGSGSYTNAYGVYIDNNNVSATNQYGLFVTGENKNYFSGNVGIGTTSPYAKLSITGSGTDTGAVFQIANSSNVPKITISDNGNIDMGSIMTVIRATSAPSAPTLSVHGTPGTATFGYKIAFKGPGGVSAASAETVITNAPSTLNGTDYISINLPTCPDSFTKVIVYRTTAPAGYHSPWTLGQTSLYGCDTTVNDQGEYANFRVMSDIVDHTAGISMNRLNITNDSSVLYGGYSALLNVLGSFVGDDWTKDGYVKTGINTGLSVKPGVYGDIPSAFGIWNTVTDDVTDGPDMANYSDFSLYGGWVDYYGSGTIAKSSGIDASIYNEANGSITNANAANFGVYNYGSGTIQNAYGVRVDSFGGGGPITNAYGVHIANQSAALNNWAVHTDQSASSTCATCSYALYNAGTAPSYFAGNVGIGTTSPAYPLSITGDSRVTGKMVVGLDAIDPWGNPTPDPNGSKISISYPLTSTDILGIYMNMYTSGAAASSNIGTSWLEMATKPSETGSYRELYGIGAEVTHMGSGIISSDLTGVMGFANYNSSAASTNASVYGGMFLSYLNNVSGSVKSLYGIYTQAMRLNGTAQDAYSLYVDQASGATNNYNIYSAGVNSKNYFEGNIGVGTVNPEARLDVASAFTQTSGDHASYAGSNTVNPSSNSSGTFEAISTGIDTVGMANITGGVWGSYLWAGLIAPGRSPIFMGCR